MDPLERAAQLKREADFLLQEVGFYDILEPHGEITFTGSYFLDVMSFPDIDLYIPPVSIEQLFQIGGQLAGSEWVYEVVFQRSTLPNLPGGLYLKPRINYGDWGRPWKIDIWSVDEAIIEKQMQPMRRFQSQMTAALREQILGYKFSILTEQHRTPTFSGFFIYQAFIDHGMTNHEEITQYLIDNGINMG